MTCRLCLRELPLRRSHIIPEFMYEAVYDAKHRFVTLRVDGTERPAIEQKGIREELLCDECEGRFQVWERYVAHLWQGKVEVPHRRDGRLITLQGVDYRPFKLFQMSVLWRAGISSHAVFERVHLGPYEEPLRTSLLAGDPGDANTFGCIMAALALDDKPLSQLIVQPTETRIEKLRAFRFVFGGTTWTHLTARRPPSPTFQTVVRSA